MPTVLDYLLLLRNRAPHLARRTDGISGLERSGEVLRLKAPHGSWALEELSRRAGELEGWARALFGPGTGLEVGASPADPERLPFPVISSKHWNHVAFWTWEGDRSLVLCLRKTDYPGGLGHDGPGPEVIGAAHPPGEPWDALPGLLDALCALARDARSYVHLVCPFPGDPAADLLEARLYGVKEWGTPGTPGPVLQRYCGRIHYTDPRRPPLGVRACLERLRRDRG